MDNKVYELVEDSSYVLIHGYRQLTDLSEVNEVVFQDEITGHSNWIRLVDNHRACLGEVVYVKTNAVLAELLAAKELANANGKKSFTISPELVQLFTRFKGQLSVSKILPGFKLAAGKVSPLAIKKESTTITATDVKLLLAEVQRTVYKKLDLNLSFTYTHNAHNIIGVINAYKRILGASVIEISPTGVGWNVITISQAQANRMNAVWKDPSLYKR